MVRDAKVFEGLFEEVTKVLDSGLNVIELAELLGAMEEGQRIIDVYLNDVWIC
jgi:hypothetical protein